MSGEITIVIDGKTIASRAGETIMEAAARESIHIPGLCHDPRLKPFTSCFLCVVEVEGMKGLQPSCSTPVSDGMKVTTANPAIFRARQTALELLLSNHYADCLGPCKLTCPAGVDVQGYISLIEKGLYSEAVALIKEANPLPAICGRVCVRPCELVCRRSLLEEGKGVGIDYLKRYAADIDLASATPYRPVIEPPSGKKVAVIGAGPAGLSAAWWLTLKGHQCHIFEAAPQPGGWLRYGIPGYRLPNEILDKEIESVTDLGVKIFCNARLGKDISFREINSNYDAVILSPGSQTGTRLGCEGDNAKGVMPGTDFLREMELTGRRPDLRGRKVIVVGGGNTAMDCCRTAVRCGAAEVTVIYRRTEKEMPANHIEIEESRNEGVKYLFLTNPVRVVSDDKGNLDHIIVISMELGEPDSSGRRRPEPVRGSEFRVDADLVLAAIGQKTDLSFLEDVNSNTSLGELRMNKWGDIETNPETLETGVANLFAAGDAVTGPDTIIGAIAQARIASLSCHQYLTGQKIEPRPGFFISRRDNFRTPDRNDFPRRIISKPRNEMPVLPVNDRTNFSEVELGYLSDAVVREEASRCLECGCVAFHDCDLQRYATQYGARQGRYHGEFNSFTPDNSHPFISFDLNKCILCGRCVRICHELAGADALGFINRGFTTHVGPGPDVRLQETLCSSCGLCISTCPTGAITENTPFKPGPVETETFVTTDFIGSEGSSVRLHHRKGFFTSAEGSKGVVNPDASIGHEARFSYRLLNLPRITKPLLKKNGTFTETDFPDALKIIAERFKNAAVGENGYFAGARLTNEEIFLVKTLAEADTGCGMAGSFQFMAEDNENVMGINDALSSMCIPVSDITSAESYFIIGCDLFETNQLTGFRVFNNAFLHDSSVTFVTLSGNERMERKADRILKPSSYYYFVKAVIACLISNNQQNDPYLHTRCTGYDAYSKAVTSEEWQGLVQMSGLSETDIRTFALEYNKSPKAVIITSDSYVDISTVAELFNLSLITGKTGKEGSGVCLLRQSCNSQGLIDAGMGVPFGPGSTGNIKNMLILGEDPVGLSSDRQLINAMFDAADFIAVQDFRLTETAKRADIILPSSFVFETGGSLTATGRVINVTTKATECPAVFSGIKQLTELLHYYGISSSDDPSEIRDKFLPAVTGHTVSAYRLLITNGPAFLPRFGNGCNSMAALFRSLTTE